MTASTLAVGDELLRLGRSDTNSAFLTEELSKIGIDTRWRLICGDDLPAIGEALQFLRRTSKWIIITGGLGPTKDDRTLQAVGKYLDRPLILNSVVEESIRRKLARYRLVIDELRKWTQT